MPTDRPSHETRKDAFLLMAEGYGDEDIAHKVFQSTDGMVLAHVRGLRLKAEIASDEVERFLARARAT